MSGYYLQALLNKFGTKAEQERGNISLEIDASKRTFTKHRYKPDSKAEVKPARSVEVVRLKRRTITK